MTDSNEISQNSKTVIRPLLPLSPRTGFTARLEKFKHEQKYLALCFAVPMLLMLLMYICWQVFPFGDDSVLVLDLNGQYVYFFEGLRDILHGDGSFLYSFKRALGGEFTGIFAYYLSSPFSIIVALLPKRFITEALFIMFLLKTGSCGLTFGIYLEATRKRSRVAAVIFSVMYALCAYAIVMQHNTMWIDNMILLPVIMLGIENLIRYGKFKMYVIALSMAIFSNFYIGYMMCIFSALYFFYAYFSMSPEERNPLGAGRHFPKALGRMALYSAIAVAVCAALLFCTYYSLTFGKTTFSNPNFTPDQRFDWLDLMSKLFIGSYDTVRPEGLPFIYCGTLTLMLLPLYFFAPHLKTREKIASGIFIAVFLVSFNVTTIDLFWHGMQRPNWLNYRYSFMLCCFMVLLAFKAFERLYDIGYRKVVCVGGILIMLLVIMQKVLAERDNVRTFTMIWLSIGIIALYLGTLRAVTFPNEHTRQTSALVLAVLVCAEMFGAGMHNISSLDSDVVYSSRTSYRTFIDGLLPVTDSIQSADTSFYRMEKTHHRKTNDSFSLKMNGLSNSTSTLNSETISLLHDFGISSKSHWSKYLGGTPVLDSLFGIKYLIDQVDSDEVREMYEETDLGNGDYTVWKNPYALSIAYGVDPSLEELEIHETYKSPFERMNAVVSAMLGEDGIEIFKPLEIDGTIKCEGTIRSAVAGHLKFEKTEAGSTHRINIDVTVDNDNVLYCYFPTDYLRECYLYINGIKNGSVFGNETDRIIEIGRFEAGETVTVSLEPTEENLYFSNDSFYFWQLDEDAFAKYMPALGESSFEIERYSDDCFKGSIDIADGDELVFTSIPYDEGWKIYADGERVDTVKLIGGTVGFTLTAGEHSLVMKYRPDCLYIGLAVSAVGLAAFAAAWIASELLRSKKLAAGHPVYCPAEAGADICPPDLTAFETDEVSVSEISEAADEITACDTADDEKDKEGEYEEE